MREGAGTARLPALHQLPRPLTFSSAVTSQCIGTSPSLSSAIPGLSPLQGKPEFCPQALCESLVLERDSCSLDYTPKCLTRAGKARSILSRTQQCLGLYYSCPGQEQPLRWRTAAAGYFPCIRPGSSQPWRQGLPCSQTVPEGPGLPSWLPALGLQVVSIQLLSKPGCHSDHYNQCLLFLDVWPVCIGTHAKLLAEPLEAKLVQGNIAVLHG